MSTLAKFASVFFIVSCVTIGSATVPSSPLAQPSTHAAGKSKGGKKSPRSQVQLGPRPYYLLDDMEEGRLKDTLDRCVDDRARKSKFSIGHRGAPLLFPEHTEESYRAAARMGAGIVECDVTFTADRELVCRHSQCDLHTTTNILAVPELASKCSQPFQPHDPTTGAPASAQCCTSDIALEEFKSLCGKMDASNPQATTVEDYLQGTAAWRTDLYSTCGTVLTHAESIGLFKELGVAMTPELKSPSVEMPYEGDYTQEQYAQQMIDEYKAARVPPRQVFAQSFDLDDVTYWIDNEPKFGQRAVFLDARVYDGSTPMPEIIASLPELKARGVRIVAPPMWALLQLDGQGEMEASEYALAARAAGLDIITWTLERDGPLAEGGGWYHQTVSEIIDRDGDT